MHEHPDAMNCYPPPAQASREPECIQEVLSSGQTAGDVAARLVRLPLFPQITVELSYSIAKPVRSLL